MRAHRRSRIVAAEGLSAAQEGSSPHLAEGSSSPSAAPDRVAPEGSSSPIVAGCTRVLIAGPRSLSLDQEARRWTKELVAAPESSPLHKRLVAAQEGSSLHKRLVAAQEDSSLHKRARRRTKGLVAAQKGSSPHKRLVAGQHKRARRSILIAAQDTARLKQEMLAGSASWSSQRGCLPHRRTRGESTWNWSRLHWERGESVRTACTDRVF